MIRKEFPAYTRHGRMTRPVLAGLAAWMLCFGLVLAAPAAAADSAPATQTVSAADLEALAATIEDDAKRQELVARIRALVAAQKGIAAEAEAPSPGARFVAILSEKLKQSSAQVAAAVDAVRELPKFGAWLRTQVSDTDAQRRWFRLLLKLAVVIGVGVVGEYLARVALARPRRALEDRAADSLLIRVPLLLARTVVDAIPIAVFAGTAYAVMPLIQAGARVDLTALTFIYCYLVARGALVLARMVLAPAVSSFRILPVEEETANYLFIWTRRLVMVSVYGFFVAEAARAFGLPAGGHAGVLKLVGLLVTAMAVVFILQNRTGVAQWIGSDGHGTLARLGMGRLRRRFADVWHVLAITYVLAVYGVWALDVAGGFEFLMRATVATVVILVAARLITTGLRRALDRGFAIKADLKARFPTLEARTNRYLPMLHVILRWAVYVVAVLAVIQAWGIDAYGWLETPFGQRLTGSAFSIIAVVVASLVGWEMIDAAVERYLNRTDADGNAILRSARARTLLPLLRNAVFVVLTVMVALIVLSELGINIGPLLAGAGVVGLAVGFGAQKLVQDVITGAFILFEDSIAVGDVVNVAGQAGVVEALSIRSIRLRDLSGNVHTIPFSTVNTVTNMTKEFSFYLFEVGVAYREDTDQVTEVLKEIGAGLQEDPDYGPFIIEPLEVLGVDQFADSAVIIKARIKTTPIKQWFVGREFNRRMKKRFDEMGIEIPFPHTTLYFGVDKDGTAPPARIVTASDGPRAPSPPPKPETAAEAPAKVDLPDGGDGPGQGG